MHKELVFRPPIEALDQDVAIDAAVRYDIIAGNERRLFRLDARNGSLFLERELDLDAERTLPGNTFSLTVQAAQVDNPLKAGVARVEVELLDLNDNLPEFEVDLYNISIVENLPNGFSVLQVMATDKDQVGTGLPGLRAICLLLLPRPVLTRFDALLFSARVTTPSSHTS